MFTIVIVLFVLSYHNISIDECSRGSPHLPLLMTSQTTFSLVDAHFSNICLLLLLLHLYETRICFSYTHSSILSPPPTQYPSLTSLSLIPFTPAQNLLSCSPSYVLPRSSVMNQESVELWIIILPSVLFTLIFLPCLCSLLLPSAHAHYGSARSEALSWWLNKSAGLSSLSW